MFEWSCFKKVFWMMLNCATVCWIGLVPMPLTAGHWPRTSFFIILCNNWIITDLYKHSHKPLCLIPSGHSFSTPTPALHSKLCPWASSLQRKSWCPCKMFQISSLCGFTLRHRMMHPCCYAARTLKWSRIRVIWLYGFRLLSITLHIYQCLVAFLTYITDLHNYATVKPGHFYALFCY